MADGINYVDTKAPFDTAAFQTVTLSTTSLQLWPTVIWTPTSGGNYWWPGKELRMRIFGTITTAVTPGNLTVEIRYGTTDAGGTILATSAAQTLIASQTTIPFEIDTYTVCRAAGTTGSTPSGSFFSWGRATFGVAVVAVGNFFIPASAPAAVTGLDTTVSSGLNIQFKRSGSTAETATVQDLVYQALN